MGLYVISVFKDLQADQRSQAEFELPIVVWCKTNTCAPRQIGGMGFQDFTASPAACLPSQAHL